MTVDLFTSAPPCTPPCYPALPAWLGRPDVAAGGSLNPDKLAVAVTRRHDVFADPKLQDVLDQIELRAHVELAKLEQLDQRVA